MQRVHHESAPSVLLLHAGCQNANILGDGKEHWLHANLVNNPIRCTQAYALQSKVGAFDQSCGEFYRLDKYLVLEIQSLKGASDKLTRKT